jgi:ADP-ribose pyrophosphatase YjhB (NUDIX family)
MLIAPNADRSAHAVSLSAPTTENPAGYHRLIGGSVETGESHREAIVREVAEELGATIRELTYVARIENIFTENGVPGHEIVFLYSGRLDPQPATVDASLTESDGTVLPVVWRRWDAPQNPVPLYPAAAETWVRRLAGSPQSSAASAAS